MEFFTIQYKANNCPTFKTKVMFPAVLLLQPEIRDFVCQTNRHKATRMLFHLSYHPTILSSKLNSRTVVFLRNSVAPDVNCSLTHLIGDSPSGCFTSNFTVGLLQGLPVIRTLATLGCST